MCSGNLVRRDDAAEPIRVVLNCRRRCHHYFCPNNSAVALLTTTPSAFITRSQRLAIMALIRIALIKVTIAGRSHGCYSVEFSTLSSFSRGGMVCSIACGGRCRARAMPLIIASYVPLMNRYQPPISSTVFCAG